MESLPPSPNHLGWYDRGYRPHFDAAVYGQAITFRLADSLPKHVVDTLAKGLLALRENERCVEEVRRFNRLLNASLGSCVPREAWAASIVQESLRFGHGDRHDLLAWAVMPNHVYALIRPQEGWRLGRIVGYWKKHSAREINRNMGRTGRLWFRDYFDRFQRDPGHRKRTISYIERNPVKAGLCETVVEWRWCSARFRSSEGAIDWDLVRTTIGILGGHSREWRSGEAAL